MFRSNICAELLEYSRKDFILFLLVAKSGRDNMYVQPKGFPIVSVSRETIAGNQSHLYCQVGQALH